MKIVRITISNFLKLKDIEINPSHTNVIVGKNKQGKTSVLKAIKAAFTGDADSSSIRIGESKAEITLELDDLTINRTFTAKGTQVEISNKEGLLVPKPQTYLNGILGTFSFNPIDFFTMKAVDRKKYLLQAIDMRITQDELAEFAGEKLAGLDYDGTHALVIIEQARKFYYEKRTAVNQEVARKQQTINELSVKIPEGFNPANFSGEQIIELRRAVTENEVLKQKVQSYEDNVATLEREVTTLEGQLAAKKEMLALKSQELTEARAMVKDTGAINSQLSVLEAQRELVTTYNQVVSLRTDLDASLTQQTKLDTAVKTLTKEAPQKLIEKAKLPVENLTITEDDVLVNGVALDNLSTSEQLRFGLDIVRNLNSTFKVVCIDGVELLDSESFELFLRETENDDFQYFITRVSTNENIPHSIQIEDGEVKPQA